MMIDISIKKKYYFFKVYIKKSYTVMTIDQLLVLRAVVQSGSFKSASEVLHKTQPALSVSIKKLEEELGFELLRRDLYRPILTVQGEYFYQKVIQVLSEVTELEELARSFSNLEEPEISIAIDGISPLPVVLRWLKEFGEKHPHTKLNLTFEVLTGTVSNVLSKKVIFGITHFLLEEDRLEKVPVCSVKMVPLMSKELWDKAGVKTEKDLRKIDQLVLSDSNPAADVNFGLIEAGQKWRVKDGQLKTHLILAGLGWGHLPEHDIKEKIESGELVVLDFKTTHPRDLEISLIKLKDNRLGPVATALWDFLKLCYKQSKA